MVLADGNVYCATSDRVWNLAGFSAAGCHRYLNSPNPQCSAHVSVPAVSKCAELSISAQCERVHIRITQEVWANTRLQSDSTATYTQRG